MKGRTKGMTDKKNAELDSVDMTKADDEALIFMEGQ